MRATIGTIFFIIVGTLFIADVHCERTTNDRCTYGYPTPADR